MRDISLTTPLGADEQYGQLLAGRDEFLDIFEEELGHLVRKEGDPIPDLESEVLQNAYDGFKSKVGYGISAKKVLSNDTARVRYTRLPYVPSDLQGRVSVAQVRGMIRSAAIGHKEMLTSFQRNGEWIAVAWTLTKETSQRLRKRERMSEVPWDSTREDLGSYSRGVPRPAKTEHFHENVETVVAYVAWVDRSGSGWVDNWAERTGKQNSLMAAVVRTGDQKLLPPAERAERTRGLELIQRWHEQHEKPKGARRRRPKKPAAPELVPPTQDATV